MVLQKKTVVWLFVLAVVVASIALAPAPLVSTVNGWLDKYSDAIKGDDDEIEVNDNEDESLLPPLTVHIDDVLAGYAGIETTVLDTTSHFPELKALAKVVDIRPLLALKTRYNQAISALNVATVAERSAAAELKRLTTLAQGVGSVATKKVSYARGVWREAKAALQGFAFEVQAVKDEALQSWGATISEWIVSDNSEQWQRLLSHQDSLLLVILPIDVSLAPGISFIHIARGGAHKRGRKAYLVSPAVTTEALTQGESYYFKIATGRLRTGMRLDAWIPTSNEAIEGVFVPDKAVVWYDGLPWVYVEITEGLYQRRSIEQAVPATSGLFLSGESGTLSAGEKLVVRGAQMLLSEEFKWQILDEDDDD